jgi:predicted O-methyltransferase YrrM/mannosyltransferase OCH1-like enzyme
MDFSQLIQELDALYPHQINDGNCCQIPSQLEKLKEIMEIKNPKNILEIGFGQGKSSILFLNSSNANVVSFDSFTEDYHKIGKEFIEKKFPNRHVLVPGDSVNTLDNFSIENTIKFDIIFIDGGRDTIPYSDLSKSATLANEDTIVIVNNYVRSPGNYAFWNEGFNNAWDIMLEKKYVTEIEQFDYFWGRGMVTGYYNFDESNKPLCIYSEYKNMNRSELYNKINASFTNKNFKMALEICELYLSYFNRIDDDETTDVIFKYAFLQKKINPEKSILLFENLLNKGHNRTKLGNKLGKGLELESELDQVMKANIEKQLVELYPISSMDEIPKIIHLLFFGETEFRPYHYKCIKSMIDNMPNHKIVIYNNIEPTGNVYWDKIKSFSVVTIEKLAPPTSFDGFNLKHFQYKADVVRIEKLYEHGGIYLDIDMLIFKNFEGIFSSKHDFYISKENADGKGLINAFIASKPKNEFLKLWLDTFKTGLRMNIWAYHIRDSNAILLRENPHYYLKYNICVLNAEEFFSISWSNLDFFSNMNENTQYSENVFGLHLFETILHHTLMHNPYFNLQNIDEPKGHAQVQVQAQAHLQTQANIVELAKKEENLLLEISDIEPNKMESGYAPIHNIVDEVIVLSLKERPEKTKYIMEHLTSFHIKHTVMLNKLHWCPNIGCFEAHIAAIEYAKEKGLKKILILEDDAFIQNINILNSLSNIDILPQYWDMLYLGGILTNSQFIKDKWVRGTIWCNHAYIVNSSIYDAILDKFSKCDLSEYASKRETIDHFYTRHFNEDFNCFLHIDQPIIQKGGYSDLSKKNKWENFNWDTFSLKNLADL